MTFQYNSSLRNGTKELPEDLVADIRKFIVDAGVDTSWTNDELQELLLSYRRPDGQMLFINHLEPIFIYLMRYGRVWD